MALNTWDHYVFTMNPTESSSKCYINKTLKTNALISTTSNCTTIPIFTGTYTLNTIGPYLDRAADARSADKNIGYIQDLRVFNRVISGTEITGLY
jgi:hypothetical protein